MTNVELIEWIFIPPGVILVGYVAVRLWSYGFFKSWRDFIEWKRRRGEQ